MSMLTDVTGEHGEAEAEVLREQTFHEVRGEDIVARVFGNQVQYLNTRGDDPAVVVDRVGQVQRARIQRAQPVKHARAILLVDCDSGVGVADGLVLALLQPHHLDQVDVARYREDLRLEFQLTIAALNLRRWIQRE